MEGFIKVLKKTNLNELKRYFFYLTYSNRADIETIFNMPAKNNLPEINEIISNNELNSKNTLKLNTPYNTYFSFRNEIRNEWKHDKVKSLELILSYSTKLNQLMVHSLGQEVWELEYRKLVMKLMKKNFKNNRHILCYFHKTDSSGYRYHTHALLYPYLNNINGFPLIYNHIPNDDLKLLKEDFNIALEELIKSKKTIIMKKMVFKIKKHMKDKSVDDSKIFRSFLNHNNELKKYF